MGDWQREIGGMVHRHEGWITQLETMDEAVQQLQATMSDIYPSHVWTLGRCTELNREIQRLDEAQQGFGQKFGETETQLAQAWVNSQPCRQI